MADRTSAEIFGTIFTKLSGILKGYGSNDMQELIEFLWEAKEEYDFTEDQMECDEALLLLGLAHYEYDEEYEEDYLVYGII